MPWSAARALSIKRGSHMTPLERQRVFQLKKERLVTKDRLYQLGHR